MTNHVVTIAVGDREAGTFLRAWLMAEEGAELSVYAIDESAPRRVVFALRDRQFVFPAGTALRIADACEEAMAEVPHMAEVLSDLILTTRLCVEYGGKSCVKHCGGFRPDDGP